MSQKNHNHHNNNQQNQNNNQKKAEVQEGSINTQPKDIPSLATINAINKSIAAQNAQNGIITPVEEPVGPKGKAPDTIEVAEDTTVVVDKPEDDVPLDGDEEGVEKHTVVDLDEVPEDVDISVESVDDDKKEDVTKTAIPLKLGRYAGSKKLKNIANITYGVTSKVETSPDYQSMVLDQFVQSRNADISGPKSMTRVVLPYSGFYFDLLSLSNGEQQNIYRTTAELSYLDKIIYELQVFYEHMKTNSIKAGISFDDWLMAIRLPDLWAIYWGVYNNHSPGENEYRSKCDKCNIDLVDKRDNYTGITFVSEESKEDISQNDIDMILSILPNGAGAVKMEDIPSYKKGSQIVEKEGVLPDSRIKVYYGMPSLYETIEFLRVLASKGEKDIDELVKRVIYPMRHLRLARYYMSNQDYVYALYCKCMLYVRKILAPVTEKVAPRPGEDPSAVKLKATYVDVDRPMIPLVLDNLSKKDAVELCKGTEMRKLLNKSGFRFVVRDSVCPSCGTKQRNLELDMRDMVFTRAAQDLNFLMEL